MHVAVHPGQKEEHEDRTKVRVSKGLHLAMVRLGSFRPKVECVISVRLPTGNLGLPCSFSLLRRSDSLIS